MGGYRGRCFVIINMALRWPRNHFYQSWSLFLHCPGLSKAEGAFSKPGLQKTAPELKGNEQPAVLSGVREPSSGHHSENLRHRAALLLGLEVHCYGQKDQYLEAESILRLTTIILGQNHKHRLAAPRDRSGQIRSITDQRPDHQTQFAPLGDIAGEKRTTGILLAP